MIRFIFSSILIVFLSQCAGPKSIACSDVLFTKQKHEKISKRLMRSITKSQTLKSRIERQEILDIPLTDLTASLAANNVESSTLLKRYPSLINVLQDTVPKVSDEETERIRAEVEKLKAEIEQKEKGFESPVDYEQRDQLPESLATYKKARVLAHVSFFTMLGTFILPLVGFFAFVASIVTGFMSLKRYKKVSNKKGRWMAVTALVIDGLVVALLGIALLVLFATWNNGEF